MWILNNEETAVFKWYLATIRSVKKQAVHLLLHLEKEFL